MSENKNCPYCGESIKSEAIKCKHCKSDLSDTVPGQKKSAYDTEIIVDRCPKCKSPIQEGVTFCGNCKAQLAWKGGKPKFTTAYAMQQTGCALTSIGCLLPILIAIIAFFVILLLSL
jgi:hypothetical protein